jgi:peptidoglycan hydrolase-like amidase
MPLYRSDVAEVTKVNSDLSYEIRFEDGTVRPTVHIQNLRRFNQRQMPTSTPQVTTDASMVSDSVDPLSNTTISHNISDIVIHDVDMVPQENPAVSQTTTPNDLNAPVVIDRVSPINPVVSDDSDVLSVSSEPVRRSSRLRGKSTIDYRAANTGRKPRR